MNISHIQLALHKAIADTTNTTDYLLLAKAIQAFNVGQIRAVSTFASLPSAASNEGLLVYVDADERLYFSNGVKWDTIYERTVTAYSWGCNNTGPIGDGTVVNRSSPVSVISGFTNWSQVSAGQNRTLAVRANGTLWAWGSNYTGELGDNSSTSKSSPVSVVGGFTDWVCTSSGGCISAGVRSNGTLWTWGCNTQGSLGNGYAFGNRSSPVSVVGGFTDWCAVKLGRGFGVALRSNGTLWSWGCQSFAPSLGDGTFNNRSSPVSVVGGFTDWCNFDANGYHAVAIRSNGTIWTWGYNIRGQLGNNSTSNSNSPVSVIGGFTDWCQAAAGASSTFGIRSNGTLWAWGFNGGNYFFGNLGDGTTVNRSSPVSVIGGFTDWCAVTASGEFTAGIRTNGTLWTWGVNSNGALGSNDTTRRSSPASVVGGFTNWKSVSGKFNHIVATISN